MLSLHLKAASSLLKVPGRVMSQYSLKTWMLRKGFTTKDTAARAKPPPIMFPAHDIKARGTLAKSEQSFHFTGETAEKARRGTLADGAK